MGRPLNKKYFGNRNIGTTGTGDNGIGGEGLAAYTLAVQKGVVAINNTYKYFPTLTIPAADLPGGVQATASVVWEINTISISSAGTDYTNNQTGAAATLTGSVWDDASVLPEITIDTNGSNAISAVNIVSRGEYTTINGTGITTWAVAGAGGTNGQVTVTFRLKSITTVQKGSGYTSVPTLSWARASSQTAGGQTQTGTPTVALTTDSGAVGSSTNQENAIIPTAFVPGGSSAVVGDIISQRSSSRFRVKTAQGTGVCQLTTGSVTEGKMKITAVDTAGNTYTIKRITERVATVYQVAGGSNYQFVDGQRVGWNLSGAVANKAVLVTSA